MTKTQYERAAMNKATATIRERAQLIDALDIALIAAAIDKIIGTRFELINLKTKASHGMFGSEDEARGAARYDRLTDWEIWECGTKRVNDIVAYRDTGRY